MMSIPIQTINFTDMWYPRLFHYMQSVYPYRDTNYLKWWLKNISNSDNECWEKCLIVIEDDTIIGCTTVNEALIMIDGSKKKIFFRGNTIISPDQRGKGISKEIYNRVNLYDNWLSVGVTDIAWKIQPKYVKNFTCMRPVNVYVSLNISLFKQLLFKCIRRKSSTCGFPNSLSVSPNEEIKRVKDVEQMAIPEKSKWTSDKIEFVRDVDFFRKRYFDIYCSERYGIYHYLSEGRIIGYVVLRKTIYKGLDMVALVDYRFYSRSDEKKAFKAASKYAKICGIGLVIALCSRKYKLGLFPATITMKKKLNCATGLKQYLDYFNDALITSADSDLDFVYYK